MAFDLKQFKDVFVSEVEDHLIKLNENLLSLEKNIKNNYSQQILQKPVAESDLELLNELMRSAHTIKSSAATMGYQKMAFFTHVLEDVFDYTRNQLITMDLKIVDKIFAGIDALKNSINSIKNNDVESDVEEISKNIKEITGVTTEGFGKSQRDENGQPIVVPSLKNENIKKNLVVKNKKEIQLTKSDSTSEVEAISHIKVPVGRLDNLMNLTEEIIIDKMRITTIINDTLKQLSTVADISRREAMLSIKPSVDHLSRLLSSLQYSVMQVRLVPVGNIFSRFPRMVRDLAKSKNKEIELKVFGEDLEVDRSIIDKLAEPLVHLLRNAIDHGIEKNGTITLDAQRDKDMVNITVQDDGRGVDWNEVVESALRKGIISAEIKDNLLKKIKETTQAEWQHDIEQFLYLGKLSTKKEVSETSGRGVGLSVVKKFVEENGGNMHLISPVKDGKGTMFVLELPLTLAITEALLIQIKNEIFAIPFSVIDRVVAIDSENIKSVGDQDVAIVEEVEVPLANLEKIFKLKNNESMSHEKVKNTINSNSKTVVLARRGHEVAGIVVDKVLNQQQIIVKPLPSVLKGVKGFSGSTILGNGEAVLIIDVISLLQNSNDLLRI